MRAPMIYLTDEERDIVRAQRPRTAGQRGHEKAHVVLRPRPDGEVDLVYAISRLRRDRGGPTVEVMAIGLASSDTDKISYRNVRFYPRAGYRVDDWTRPLDGNAWGYAKATAAGAGDIPGIVANPGALAGTRYAHAGIDEECWGMRPAAYLRILREFPSAELLYKAGLHELIRPSILRAGKPMARFIVRNLEAIRASEANALAVATAFRRGLSIEAAILRIQAQRDMAGVPRPKGVDAVELKRYLARAKIDTWEYKRHAEHCRALGLGASAWMPAPKRFRRVAEEVEATHAKQEARLDRIRAAKKRARERKILERFAAAQDWAAAAAAPATAAPACAILAVWPRSAAELREEGGAMDNCINNGLYLARVAAGDGALAFLREASRPGAPWVDAEFRLEDRKWHVAQCYAAGNEVAPDAARRAAQAICKALNKAERKRGEDSNG